MKNTKTSKIKGKIKTIETLVQKFEGHRRRGKRLVLCHGCFDLLHIGHIRHFERAKEHGDVLAVTITPDRYVDKGIGRPAFNENIRAEALASLDVVDYVAINQWPTAEETLRMLRPDFYAKGSEFKAPNSDYTGKIDREVAVVEEIGAHLVYTEDVVFSSSNLINRFLSNRSQELHEYLEVFTKRYSIKDIHAHLDKLSDLKVLVLGDTILDDYCYCEAIGKSSKDPVLAVNFKTNDLFVGGVLAVANHVAGYVDDVKLMTVIGEKDSHEDFIRSKLDQKIQPQFLVQDGAPTLIKRRILDGYSYNKLLEIYIMDDSGLPPAKNEEFCRLLAEYVPTYDLVIVADFGHGAISDQVVQTLCRHARFLAVNTQANAGNRGFHTISRYPRADFVSLAEHEVRLDTREMTKPLRPIMQDLADRLGTKALVVTRGQRGALILDHEGGFVSTPSLATNVVDRVGAGDAFFAITALASAKGVPSELLGMIGNAVGALAVGVIGNKKPINKMDVKKFITALLK
jgi:rfaE bifunctional protein kinase chain/domain